MSDFRKFCIVFSVAITVGSIIGLAIGKYSVEEVSALAMIWAASFVAVAGRPAK